MYVCRNMLKMYVVFIIFDHILNIAQVLYKQQIFAYILALFSSFLNICISMTNSTKMTEYKIISKRDE